MRERPWVTANAILLVWAVMPELRRLIDWKVGFNSISVISIVPLLALVPLVGPLLYSDRLKRLDRGTAVCLWLWFGGLIYALIVALAGRNFLSGSYAFALFGLPAVFGMWLASSRVAPRELYERIAPFMLWLGSALALYGAIQFVVGPAWDMAWLRSANLVAVGSPAPFMFRPFSTLNSPGLFADFLTVTFLLNLPRFRRPTFARLVQGGFVLAVLVLTMVRSDWVAVMVGTLCYVLLSPDRLRNVMLFAGVGIIGGVLVVNASTLLGSSDAGTSIASRFSTLGDLGTDRSYNVRRQYFGAALTSAEENPLGAGLGVVGTAAKLGSNGETVDFDNGYIARFTEMGYFGTACYLAAVFGVTIVALRRWNELGANHDRDARALAAGAIAAQIALIALDVSSDHHNAFPGLLFWMSTAIVPLHPFSQAEAARESPSDAARPATQPARRFA